MNSLEMEYYFERYGLEDTAKRLAIAATPEQAMLIQMHVANINAHQMALKSLLLSLAEDDE